MPAIHIATLPTPAPPSPTALLKRNSSTLALSSRISSLNLFGDATTLLTPTAEIDDPFNADSRRNSRLLNTPTELRKLLHSEADVPEWGSTAHLYGQPRSRAGPLPSKSVTDFRRMREEAMSETKRKPMPATSSSGAGEYSEWTIVPALRGNGALLNAIQAAISAAESNDETLDVSWVGTLGFPTDALPEGTKTEIDHKLHSECNSDVVYVTDEDFAGHYANFCKVVLWPLFHYQVPDDVNSKAYMDRSWSYYYNVNLAFAEKLIANYRKDDTIWLHDYHLLLVPRMIRDRLPEAKIGFFLHTPFPSSEIFRCQMKYKELLHGMLGANLIAFQLPEYQEHFFWSCNRFLQHDTTSEGVQLEGRFVNVTSQPIGINPAEIEKIRDTDEFSAAVNSLQQTYEGKRLIVSRDKLDRIHGVRQKLLAYERFLDQYPHKATEIVLVQILSNHETTAELRGRINEIYTRITRKHASFDHQPLQIHERDITSAQYYAFLTVADALMISTQRDGMNLTGHEFVFCQDGKMGKCHGTLILSEFAGCAEVLKSGILCINPWNIKQQAEAIGEALNMEAAAKQARWTPLYETVMTLTGCHWFQKLDSALTEAHKTQGDRAASSVPRLLNSEVNKAYDRAGCRVFLLDYEGTLLGHQTGIGAMLTSPPRVIGILNELILDPKNVVYVTSGSSWQELAQVFQTASGVGLVAENGCFVLEHGEKYPWNWQTAIDEDAMLKWKTQIREQLHYYLERAADNVVEERGASIVVNFAGIKDKADIDRVFGKVVPHINASSSELRAKAIRKDRETLLVEQVDFNKKTMAATIFEKLQQDRAMRGEASPEFMMVAGDDREDEVLFEWANALGKEGVVRDVFTVSTSTHDTAAKAAMSKGSAGLLSLLEKLAQSSLKDRPVKNPATKRSSRSIPKAHFDASQPMQ